MSDDALSRLEAWKLVSPTRSWSLWHQEVQFQCEIEVLLFDAERGESFVAHDMTASEAIHAVLDKWEAKS